jgi:hypothetical protein
MRRQRGGAGRRTGAIETQKSYLIVSPFIDKIIARVITTSLISLFVLFI